MSLGVSRIVPGMLTAPSFMMPSTASHQAGHARQHDRHPVALAARPASRSAAAT